MRGSGRGKGIIVKGEGSDGVIPETETETEEEES